MTESSSPLNPADEVIQELVARIRSGDSLSVDRYCKVYPDQAELIRKLVPTLIAIEGVKQQTVKQTLTHSSEDNIGSPTPRLEEYEIVRCLGVGGMGVVYEARQIALSRTVAIKVLSEAFQASASRILRFEREALASAALHHSNIVPVFDIGREDVHSFFVMQYIDGCNLADALAHLQLTVSGLMPTPVVRSPVSSDSERQTERLERFSIPYVENTLARLLRSGTKTSWREYYRRVGKLMIPVADAIQHAHESGIWHRDIKPSNILLDRNGNPWVTDFGLAKFIDEQDSLTQSGELVGTLRYLPPESFQGVFDERSDVYSLGITLYELLALQPAFTDGSRAQLLKRVLTESPQALQHAAPAIPAELATIVHKAIAREPTDRYASAREFRCDLERFTEGLPIAARKQSIAQAVSRWCRSNPAVATLSALMFCVICVLAASQWQVLTERNRTRSSLWEALVANAKFQRNSGTLGQRLKSLKDLSEATAIESKIELRDEAIRAMTLFDLDPIAIWPSLYPPQSPSGAAVTREFSHYVSFDVGSVQIKAISQHADKIDSPVWSSTFESGSPHASRFSARGNVLAVSFSTGFEEMDLRVWCWRSREDSLEVDGSSQGAEQSYFFKGVWDRAFDFSPDESTLAVGIATQEGWLLNAYDLETREAIWQSQLATRPSMLRYSPDGQCIGIALPEEGIVAFYDATDGNESRPPMELGEEAFAFAWAPCGRMLAVGKGYDVELYDLESIEVPRMQLRNHNWMVHDITFNPSGSLAASYSLRKNVTRIWDLRRQRQVLEFDGYLLSFDESGNRAVAFIDRQLKCFAVHGDRVYQAIDRTDGIIDEQFHVTSIGVEGSYIASGGSNSVALWSLSDGRLNDRVENGPVDSLAASRGDNQGTYISATGLPGMATWCIEESSATPDSSEVPIEIKLAPYNPSLPSGIDPKNVRVWLNDVGGNTHVFLLDYPRRIVAVNAERALKRECRISENLKFLALSPDGRWVIASNHETPGFYRWDWRKTTKPVEMRISGSGGPICFSPDGKLLVASTNFGYHVFETHTWTQKYRVETDQSAEGAMAFTSSSQRLALTLGPGNVRIYSAADGKELLNLDAEWDQVNIFDLEFAGQKSEKLLMACGTGGLRCWHLDRLDSSLQSLGLAYLK